MFSIVLEKFGRVTNHPVHIVDEDGQLSPTALIPFCEFGGNMSVTGVKIDQFDVPVCNSFSPKIYKDQLCYTVDPNKFINLNNLQSKFSISLAIDFNEERQFANSMKITEETLQCLSYKTSFMLLYSKF